MAFQVTIFKSPEIDRKCFYYSINLPIQTL